MQIIQGCCGKYEKHASRQGRVITLLSVMFIRAVLCAQAAMYQLSPAHHPRAVRLLTIEDLLDDTIDAVLSRREVDPILLL